jgi:hypothetical protein
MEATSHARLSLTSRDNEADILTALRALPEVKAAEPMTDAVNPLCIRIESEAADICPRLFAMASAEHWPVAELSRETITLEAVFNELTAATDGGER